jgi:hypothetical protein
MPPDFTQTAFLADAFWRRNADIRRKRAEAELVGKAAILSGGWAGTSRSTRTTVREFPSGPSREPTGFDDQVRAKVSSTGDDCPEGGRSAAGARANPPHRSVHPTSIIHS